MILKKPTKKERELLEVIGKLQDLIGRAKTEYMNDRSPERYAKVVNALDEGFNLCLEAREPFDI